MKIILVFFLLINILFSKENVIKIAISKNMIPYSFIDENNKAKGMLVDYWNLWASKNKQKIKFVPLTWTDTLKAIKNNKVDIHSGLFINDERKKYIDFLKPIYQASAKIYTKKNDSKNILKMSDLNNKKIGLIENSFYISYIKENYKEIKTKKFKSIDKMINALFKEEIDGIIDETLITWFHLAKRYKHNEVNFIKDFTLKKSFYSAINKSSSNKKLKNMILSGINKISQNELNKIITKWMFHKKENPRITDKSIFTIKEQNYIKNSPFLKVGIENWGDFIKSNDGKRIEGFAGEIITKVFEISGLKYKIVQNDWFVLLNAFKNKKIDILPATYFTKKRAKFGLYTKKYLSMKDFIYVKKTNKNIKSLADLNFKKLAIVKEYGTIPLIREKFPNIKIVETKDLEDSISLVLNGKVEAFFESQIVSESKIKELSISVIKGIYQNDIKANNLHIFSKKEDLILHSIMQKSLDAIPKEIKDKIIKKWLNPIEKKSLNIAFGRGMEPYSIDKSYLKGIEYDLVNKILKNSNITIKNITNLNYDKLQNALNDDRNLDIVVRVKEKDDGYYYSNDFMSLENIAITRVKDNISINNINDLKYKRVASFEDAYKSLGNKYFKLFNKENRPKNYLEYIIHEQQVKDFFSKKADVIILDKNIFLWHLKRLTNDDLSKYKFSYIFPKKNSYKVAFKEEQVRNIFNKNLKILEKKGDIKNIYFNYINSDIEAKVKIDSLISSIVSKFIFTENISELKKIITKISLLKYINKIEVFNNRNVLLSSSSKKEFKKYTLQDSHYMFSNIPRKVGFIKVYFNEDILMKYSKEHKIIPKINYFNSLDSFSYIKKIYKRFSYLDKDIIFTKKEKDYIKNNSIVTFTESNWDPLFIMEKNNSYNGLISDYIKIIEKKTGLYFKFIPSNTWLEAISTYKKREAKTLPSMNDYEKGSKDGLLSDTYTNFSFAIVTNKEGTFKEGIKDLKNKTLALPFGFAAYNHIKKNFPEIKIIKVKDNIEALDLVSRNKADAFVGHMAVAIHNIKHYFQDLKIVGLSKFKYEHQFLVQKEEIILLSIINKVIASISQKQKEEIKEKWIKTEINTEVDYSIIYKIVAIFILILLIVLYFIKKLSVAKNSIEVTNFMLNKNIVELKTTKEELEDSNHELEVSLENLKKTQDKLVDSEKMASLGGLVAGVAHEINTPVGIGLTGSTHFMEITKDIINKFDNENMTKEDFKEYTDDSLELANLIYSNLEKTSHLIKSFKQISVDQTSEQKRKFKLNNYINEILVSISSVLKKTNVNIIIKQKEEILLNSYPGAISQIITNLIFNSLNHGYKKNESGSIIIELYKKNDKTVIIYKDDGQGIPKENISKIFDPFFTTNREKGGTGLGLNIIYNIVTTQLNGIITCNSIEGFGVEFIIEF